MWYNYHITNNLSQSTEYFQLVYLLIHLAKVLSRKTLTQINIYTLLHLHPCLRINQHLQLSAHRLQPQRLVVLPLQPGVQTSCDIQLKGNPLSYASHSLLEIFGKLFHSEFVMSRNQLYFWFDLSDTRCNFVFCFVNFLMECIFE